MVNDAPSVRSIFEQALELASDAERAAFLDVACAGQAEVRSNVEALLRAHAEVGSFLAHAACETNTIAQSTTAPDGPGDSSHLASVHDHAFDLSLSFLAPSEAPGSLGRLNQYDVFEVLGQGGMGIVLKGRDSRLDRVVAIKVASPLLAFSASGRQRFIREAKAAAAVRHDHVVTIHDVGEIQGLPYLVMEYVAGDSLQQRIDRQGPLGVREILQVGMQTALGLAAAHEQGLVHRDIKPANILLASDPERVKISDFGLARSADDVSITQTGVIAGTPQYMAPEQARGEAVDSRADLFSLGSVLYAMCTGQAPYRATHVVAVLRNVCEQRPQAITELNPAIPSWLIAIVDKLHNKNLEDRFQSARDVADLLNQGRVHLEDPARTPAPQVANSSIGGRSSSSRKRRWRHIVAVAGILLVGLAVAEVAGVTHLAPAVMRLAFGEGVLVVEVDDPSISVEVDNEKLVIKGAGPQEIRIAPGKHSVAFSRDGKSIDEQFVTISRNGREVVRVDREKLPAAIERDDVSWKLPTGAPPPAIAPFDAEEATELQAAWAKYLDAPVEYVNSVGMKLRLIPPGEFALGSSGEEVEDLQRIGKNIGWPDWEINEINFEAPQRIVRVEQPFYLATCETTVANFRAFVESTGYVTTGERTGDGGWAAHEGQWVRRPEHVWKSPAPWKLVENQPVVQLSHRDAEAFCNWLSEQETLAYSLPRETQWEMAARAGTTRRYGPSDSPDALLEWAWTKVNLPADRPEQPQPVGQKVANRWGLHDMLGNVWEMCSDVHAGMGNGRRAGRGGSFMNPVIRSRPASRAAAAPDIAWDCAYGFRAVITGDLKAVGRRNQEERVRTSIND